MAFKKNHSVQHSSYQQQVENIQNEITELQQISAEHEHRALNETNKNTVLQERLEQFEQEDSRDLKQEVMELKQKLEIEQIDLDDEKEMHATARGSLKEKDAAIKDFNTKMTEKDAAIKDFSKKLIEKDAKLSLNNDEITIEKTKIKALAELFKESEEKQNAELLFRSQIEAAQSKQITDLTNEKTKLLDELSAEKEEIHRQDLFHTKQYTKLKTENEGLVEENEILVSDYQTVLTTNKKLDVKNEKLSDEIQTLTNENLSIHEACVNLEDSNATWQSRAKSFRQKYDEAKKKNACLEESLENVKSVRKEVF